MIGIGITTLNRPDHLGYCLKMHEDFSGYDLMHVSKGEGGISQKKNESLKILQDCDYVFLFDDDCFPIREGWEQFFIGHSLRSGQQHFMYMNGVGVKKVEDGIGYYDHCQGVMLFMTKKCIESVGGFSPNFKKYGFEHANYSDRIHAAGLTPVSYTHLTLPTKA